jgi:hypothetical protein
MWLVPLAAAAVAAAFAVMLGRLYAARRSPSQLLWTIAMAMFAAASGAAAIGVGHGWTRTLFTVYWAFGAVLTVPFLAGGEVVLLFRRRWVLWVTWLVLIFASAFTFSVLRRAGIDAVALAERLPSGKEVFGDGTAAHRLPQLFSYPAYAILVAGALWSAWRMRRRPELRDRFVGTLLIAIGATIVAGGAGFAATGMVAGFCITLMVGISTMFWGFLRAARPVRVPDAAEEPSRDPQPAAGHAG